MTTVHHVVEIVYSSGCPRWHVAMDRVRHAVTELGLSEVVDIRKNQVGSESEASEIAFLGSPSIRVDGQDVELGVSPDGTFGLRCRLYHVDGRPDEAPPINWIKRALLAADT